MREWAGECLVAWPPRFTLPTGAGIKDRFLSRLAFFARYESLLRCLAIRESRAEARPTQVLLGQVIELRARTSNEMEVIGDLIVEPEADGFPAWLLVRDNEEGRRAQVEYADYWYRNKPYGGPDSPHRAIAGVQQITTSPSPQPLSPRAGERGRGEGASARGKTILRLNYARAFKDHVPAPHPNPSPSGRGAGVRRGERFLLYPRFTDFTTDGIVRFLGRLDQTVGQVSNLPGRLETGTTGAELFLRLLRNPEEAAETCPLSGKTALFAGRAAQALGFTPSQERAYEAICRQRATAVWGPPGTGKTHFLASAILGLASAHARAGQPFRVLVTAYTHAAIENLLRKLTQRQQELSSLRVDLQLGKAKYWQGTTPLVEVVAEDDLADWLGANRLALLGATPYSCLKKRDELPGFDLVVIDEASQVRVPESAVAVSLIGAAGRLVLAGDHLQLPPIVAGTYPDAPPGEPVLHHSIFEAVCCVARPESTEGALVVTSTPFADSERATPPRQSRMTGCHAFAARSANTSTPGHNRAAKACFSSERQPPSRLVRPLLENFRMNDVLTSMAAHLLYGLGYQCVDATVAGRRLAFSPGNDLDELVRACLDPDAPLVLVILDGIRAAQANAVEADLVAQLVTALRDGLRDSRGKPYRDDATFFRHGVFIVSPHHAQIQAVQHELAKQRHWQVRPFVDTVDKMQGQEADAVIVSYGVADPEFALREAEFIYGLNRLNVAITRARTKCVLCLPRPLLEATPQVLDTESAAVGLAFMRRLVATAENAGEELLFEGEKVEAHVLQVKRPIMIGEILNHETR